MGLLDIYSSFPVSICFLDRACLPKSIFDPCLFLFFTLFASLLFFTSCFSGRGMKIGQQDDMSYTTTWDGVCALYVFLLAMIYEIVYERRIHG